MPAPLSLRPSLASASKTPKGAVPERGRDVVVHAAAPPPFSRSGLFELRAPQAMHLQPCVAEPVAAAGAQTAGQHFNQVKVRGNGAVDILKRMGAGSEYSSSGSGHEINSVCLAERVLEFLEDEAEYGKCGRARCNCEDSTCGDSSCSTDDEDSISNRSGETQSELLRSLIPCVSDFENTILAEVTARVEILGDDIVNSARGEKSSNRLVISSLRAAGYNAAICKSRWEHVGGCPGGDYEYIDVISAKSERVIVDIDFRTEFAIARPSVQYKAILQTVPAIFVGKADRLLPVLNIICDASRRSWKKKGMSLPPWRKPEYIKAKWFSLYKRTTNASSSSSRDGGDMVAGMIAFRGPGLDSNFTTELETSLQKAADMRKVLRESNGVNFKTTMAAIPAFKKQEAPAEPEGVVRGARRMLTEMELMKTSKSDATVTTSFKSIEPAAAAEWTPPPVVNWKLSSQRSGRKVSGLASIFKQEA